MNQERLKKILKSYRAGRLTEGDVLEQLKLLPYQDLTWAKIDTHRVFRLGFPEVIFAPGKTVEQLEKIVRTNLNHQRDCLVTRLEAEKAEKIKKLLPDLHYFPQAKLLSSRPPQPKSKNYVAVVSAGTSDLPVAEEAALSCEILGTRVKRLWDVGVAGLHRLLDHLKVLNQASCQVVVAGMEGALPSVVAGLVGQVVVAVPTSVGYGAQLQGFSSLLTMLNSCSPNVVVVNIDNGFGAGFVAHLIAGKK
ncbi:MAG: nickel pincer cofactor biosynthesis protein LarB [Candidatus Omnitrophica bacterium]|nr:nickel pincer cofactor biosynthesis protein LarB [Candidatus Omnitrophota bacterium]